MEKTSKRWTDTGNVLRNIDDMEIRHATEIPQTEWIDDMKCWPTVEYKDIFNYMVLSEGVDGESMRNYKSMESYHYFQALKVGAVLHHEVSSGLLYLKADVTPSQSVNNAKHQAWVLVRDNGMVETAGCSCIAGKGKSCSHAGAILWKLEFAASSGRSGLSCTDQQQQWNKGTTKNLEPRRLENIDFRKKKHSSALTDGVFLPNSRPKLPSYLTGEEMEMAIAASPVSRLFKFGMAGKVLAAKCEEPLSAMQKHTNHDSDQVACNMCQNFFNKYIFLTNDQITILERKTVGQSLSDLWQDTRRMRITASTAKKVPVREQTKPDNFLREQIYPSFKGNSATRYGQEAEHKALQEMKKMGCTISSHGAYVSATEPWLSASPDGIDNDEAIVEIKCPLLKDGTGLCQKLQEGFCVCDVEMFDGMPKLKEGGTRGYYKQVQLTMFCTGHRLCKYFVWSEQEHLLIEVKYNEQYVQHEVARLRKFYFQHMLPRLSTDFQDGRFKLSVGYRQLCSA